MNKNITLIISALFILGVTFLNVDNAKDGWGKSELKYDNQDSVDTGQGIDRAASFGVHYIVYYKTHTLINPENSVLNDTSLNSLVNKNRILMPTNYSVIDFMSGDIYVPGIKRENMLAQQFNIFLDNPRSLDMRNKGWDCYGGHNSYINGNIVSKLSSYYKGVSYG